VQPNGATSVREWPIAMPKIDVGTNGMFIFYIVNMSSQFVDVTLPEFVTFERANRDTKDSTQLKRPHGLAMMLTPSS
jgi:hypothetical protein